MTMISAVVPCYNEEESIPLFYTEFRRVAEMMRGRYDDLSFEILFIDDGSTDASLMKMRELAGSEQPRWLSVRFLSFSRNFGKEAALYAGLQHAKGEYVATMDVDLQDPPSLLPEMYADLQTGEYDNVATRRQTRSGEPPVRSFFAKRFYKVINKLSGFEIVDGARDFRLMKRQMVDAILSMSEYNRFSKGIFSWVGFRTKWVSYDNVNRAAGKTKWNFFSLLLYSIDGIVAFSTSPLSIASVSGILLCFLAILAMAVIIVRTLLFGDEVAGWPSLVCLITFIGGLQLFCLGVLGQYLAKTYLETKRRPLYVIRDSNIERADA